MKDGRLTAWFSGLDRDEGIKKEEIVRAPRSSVGTSETTLRMRQPLAPQVHGCQVVESQNMITHLHSSLS